MTAIAIEDLTVRYGRITALDAVGLRVEAGTVYALLGRNGAGKSTLVRCLLGEQRPAAGRARLFGEDVWRRRAPLMRRLGVVPEAPDAPPAATANDLLAFSRRLYPRCDLDAARQRLRRYGVPLDRPCGRLSKGQRAQLALALALAHGPELLVLDDPTLGLDALARRDLLDQLIDELATGARTVFLTTHDLAGVERIADRVGILECGRLVVDEELDGLKGRCRRIALPRGADNGQAAARLRPFAPLQVTARSWGTEALLADFDAERFARLAADGALGEVEVVPLTLEEIFVALSARGEAP
jgi:ABC-2 type transport system ATP-binding protein